MLTKLLLTALHVYSWLIIIRVLASWFAPTSRNEILVRIYYMTEPLLGILRRFNFVPGMDLSPIMALLLISLIRSLLM